MSSIRYFFIGENFTCSKATVLLTLKAFQRNLTTASGMLSDGCSFRMFRSGKSVNKIIGNFRSNTPLCDAGNVVSSRLQEENGVLRNARSFCLHTANVPAQQFASMQWGGSNCPFNCCKRNSFWTLANLGYSEFQGIRGMATVCGSVGSGGLRYGQKEDSVSMGSHRTSGPLTPCRYMAGHSKWQNIRHIKSSKDAARSLVFAKLAYKIRTAVREGGSADPKVNNTLAKALDEAKARDMPKDSIAAALKAASSREAGAMALVEFRGPGSCLWIVETYTDKPKRTKMELFSKVKKFGLVLSDGNTAVKAFERKGLIEVGPDKEEEINMDSYLDLAIETGAEDVDQRVDEEGRSILAFTCDVNDLHSVRQSLEGQNLPVKDYYINFVPRVPAMVSGAEIDTLRTIVERIREHPEVVRVFDNVQVMET